MRLIASSLAVMLMMAGTSFAQDKPAAPGAPAGASEKKNANPCRDEVAEALKKLRSASWFRMNTSMITENGPVSMEIDYVLPDRMHQTVTQKLTQQKSEIILVGNEAWGSDGTGWKPLAGELTSQLKAQMYESVVEQQTDVGEYACKGKMQLDGRDAIAYKLEDEPSKDSAAPKNATFRMFYVDALTGMPLSNALLVPGRENAPLFKATYTYPVDMKIDPPKDVATTGGPAPAATAAPAEANK